MNTTSFDIQKKSMMNSSDENQKPKLNPLILTKRVFFHKLNMEKIE